MNDFEKLFSFLMNKVADLNARQSPNWRKNCVELIKNLETFFLDQMCLGIQKYINNPEVVERIGACNLGERQQELKKVFATVAYNYIHSPFESTPQKFTILLQQTLSTMPIFTSSEVTKILEALNLRDIDNHIEMGSLSHEKSEQDLLLLLKNSIWIADRLVQIHDSNSLVYPNMNKVKETLKLFNRGGFNDSDITIDFLDAFKAESSRRAAPITMTESERMELLSDLIQILKQATHINKRTRFTDTSITEPLPEHVALLQQLKDFKDANKPINLPMLYDLKALDVKIDLNINNAVKHKILLQQTLLTKEMGKSAGVDGIKLLLNISGCESWDQIVSDPKLFFSQIGSNLLFYVIVVLASKASEDYSVPLNFLAKTLGVYRPPNDPEYHKYLLYVRQLTALEKLVVTILKHDLSLDQDKMSTSTKYFFESMGYMRHRPSIRHN